jgi:tRNA(Ile)-lysidine synthase
MPSLVERVARTIRRHDLLPPGTRVAVAISGGSDSVALLHILRELSSTSRVQVAGLVHVNHRLRGDDADRDEAFCIALADRLGLPIVVERVDVRARAGRERTSIENAGRLVRLEAFERAARQLDAGAVAAGHTRQDQAETVLMHLLRGAGSRGLGAIAPRRGLVVRPLLDVGREELRDWLRRRGIAYVDDETNADLGNPRNRLRHTVIPALVTHFGPYVRESLGRAADTLRDEDRFLESLTDRVAAGILERHGAEVEIRLPALASLDLALQRRLLLRAMRLAGVRHVGTAEVDRVSELVAGPRPSTDLPGGVVANRIGDRVVLLKRESVSAPTRRTGRTALPIPGEIVLDEAFSLRAEYPVRLAAGTALSSPDRLTVAVSPSVCESGLFVREWRPGDALRPLGLGGRKKVQDLFVDRKVPRRDRPRVPLVVDRHDRIVWVAGHALEEAFKVTAPADAVVILTITPFGGAR